MAKAVLATNMRIVLGESIGFEILHEATPSENFQNRCFDPTLRGCLDEPKQLLASLLENVFILIHRKKRYSILSVMIL